MKKAGQFATVFVTAPDRKTARMLARAALKHRLVACANLISGIESHYWWKGKIERANEVLILFKTTRRHLPELEKLILKLHPYDTPEFVHIKISGGTRRYLNWIADSTEKNK